MAEKSESSGTARELHEFAEYEMLEFDYGPETAVALTAKAIQKADATVTHDDVKGAVKVIRALRTGCVDIAAERQRAEDRAAKASRDLLKGISEFSSEHDDEIV